MWVNKASDKTDTDYEIDNQGYIEVKNLISAIADLYCEADRLLEEYEDLKNDMDNYYEIKAEWRDWRDEM